MAKKRKKRSSFKRSNKVSRNWYMGERRISKKSGITSGLEGEKRELYEKEEKK